MDAATSSTALRAAREANVREHMDSENRHEFEATIATFGHPRYEIVPTGDVFDGADEVRRYFDESRTAFPDQRNTLIEMHHADDSILVEFDLEGTHLGAFRGLPPTGRAFSAGRSRSSSSSRAPTGSSASASTSTPRRSSVSSASPMTP